MCQVGANVSQEVSVNPKTRSECSNTEVEERTWEQMAQVFHDHSDLEMSIDQTSGSESTLKVVDLGETLVGKGKWM